MKLTIADSAVLAEVNGKAESLLRAIHEDEPIPVHGTIYYISEHGDDNADGLSPESAWQSIGKLKSVSLKSGDGVYFERGGRFRGKFKAVEGVTYSAYGRGDKPMIIGSPFDSTKYGHWDRTEYRNVYRFSERMSDDVGIITYNNGEGYIGKICINFRGEYADATCDRIIRERLNKDLTYYHDCGGANTGATADTGYLYLYSEKGNPAERFYNLEFNTRGNVISGTDSVTIANLCIPYGGSHGVGAGTCRHLHITHCEFAWIGGSVQFYANGGYVRFGNAVEIYGGCDDYIVDHCHIHDVYDAGVTHQRKGECTSPIINSNVTYSNNLFERCVYSIEYFNDIQGAGEKDSIMRHIRIVGNICRDAGGFGFAERPNKVARHIQGGWLSCNRKYPAEDYIVENNIFDRSIDTLISISSTEESHLPQMHKNTYLQYVGRNYGMYGTDYSFYYPFDDTVFHTIWEIQKESDAKIYGVV